MHAFYRGWREEPYERRYVGSVQSSNGDNVVYNVPFSLFISEVGDLVLGLWIDPLMENPWTLIHITVTFLMVLRVETTAMDWVSLY